MEPTSTPLATRNAILRATRVASQFGLMAANQGNFSVRDPQTGLIVITPHDRAYDEMGPDELVVIDPDGRQVEGAFEASYDVRVHCAIYRHRSDVHAVIHTEPPYVNAFGAVGLEIAPITTTGLKSANGSVPIMPFRPVRDERFADEMLALMGDRHAIVWGNHGMLVIASTIEQALDRSHGIEFNAKVLAIARALGTPRSLAYLDAAMIVA